MSNQIVYIGLDDTDNYESGGTGRLARGIAEDLKHDYQVLGVTRHQLLLDPRIPSTAKNSSAAIFLRSADVKSDFKIPELISVFERVRSLMMSDFHTGSDPGLCITVEETARKLAFFGERAKREVLTQEEARFLAASNALLLEGLEGTQDGIIGAMAAVGLAASGEDGRYIQVGCARDLSGLLPVTYLLESGISRMLTLDGKEIREGQVLCEKLRPSRRGGQPVLYVEWNLDHWVPLKLD